MGLDDPKALDHFLDSYDYLLEASNIGGKVARSSPGTWGASRDRGAQGQLHPKTETANDGVSTRTRSFKQLRHLFCFGFIKFADTLV
jgi:hypothetical protein